MVKALGNVGSYTPIKSNRCTFEISVESKLKSTEFEFGVKTENNNVVLMKKYPDK